jgi:hypothetical protein
VVDADRSPSPKPGQPDPTPGSPGTVRQVQAFLDWVIRTRYPVGMALTTMIWISSTWRSVTTTLNVDDDMPLSAVDPVETADRFATRAARQPFTSHATYRTRLRRAISLSNAHRYRTEHPNEQVGHPDGSIRDPPASASRADRGPPASTRPDQGRGQPPRRCPPHDRESADRPAAPDMPSDPLAYEHRERSFIPVRNPLNGQTDHHQTHRRP